MIRRNAAGLAAVILLLAAFAAVGVLLSGATARASAAPAATIEIFYGGNITPSDASITTCDTIVLDNGLLPVPSSAVTVTSLSRAWVFRAQTVGGGVSSLPITVPQVAGTYRYNLRQVGIVTTDSTGEITVSGTACAAGGSPTASDGHAQTVNAGIVPVGGVGPSAAATAPTTSSGVAASDSNRHLGVPAAIAIVLLIGVGGALGRVLLAQPAAAARRVKRSRGRLHLRHH